MQLGDPKDPDSGYVIACLPNKECRLTKDVNGDQIFAVEETAVGENDVLPILRNNAISFRSLKFPGYYMVERIKNGKNMIMLDTVDRSSKAHSKILHFLCC